MGVAQTILQTVAASENASLDRMINGICRGC
jgi:hypothetical protein